MRLRIGFASPAWLNSKIDLVSDEQNSQCVMHESIAERSKLMHESVRLAARIHPGTAECLPRSIVLADMLRQRGFDARVKLGVAKLDQKLASHAWVECQGVTVGERESVGADFTKLKL